MSHTTEIDQALVPQPEAEPLTKPQAKPKSNLLRILLIIFVVAPATLVGLGIGTLYLLFYFFPMDCGGGGQSAPMPKAVTQPVTKPAIAPTAIPQSK